LCHEMRDAVEKLTASRRRGTINANFHDKNGKSELRFYQTCFHRGGVEKNRLYP
jgi:hypothetical protein